MYYKQILRHGSPNLAIAKVAHVSHARNGGDWVFMTMMFRELSVEMSVELDFFRKHYVKISEDEATLELLSL